MQKKLWPFLITCSLVLSISLSQGARADVALTTLTAKTASAVQITADAFEKSVKAQADSISVELQAPNADRTALKKKIQKLEDALMQRLHNDKITTDATILAIESVWRNYEFPLRPPAKPTYPESKRFLDLVIPLMNNRPELQAQLYGNKGNLFQSESDWADASKEYEKESEILDRLHTEIDLQRMQSIVYSANMQGLLGNKKEAEAFDLEALSYDWYKIKDPEAYQNLRGLYVEAGMQLLNIRRFNLDALQNTFFVDSTMDELGPTLKQYIEEAKNKHIPH